MQDITNEQYLAGCILLEGSVIWGLADLVKADDFQNEYCKAIYVAAQQVAADGGVVDVVSVRTRAARNGVDLPISYLTELVEITPTAANFAVYAERVAEDGRTRRIKDLAERIQYDTTSTSAELLECLQKETGKLSKSSKLESNSFLSLFKPLSDFEEEEAAWLIPGWIPEGQITLIAADGGVGKTTLWCNIMASLSSGRPCILDPDGFTREPQKVAFCTTEDSVRKKLLKKLREAGANMDNIIAMDMSADKDGSLRNFKFGSPQMEQFVKHFKPAACAFDPVQGFIPADLNMGSRNAMRDCMAPLITLGEDTGTTFIIICHTNKRKGAFGRDRIADSADLWDIARSVIMAGYTESQGVRYLSNEKNNYAQLRETVLFSINESGQIFREGTSWKRDKDYMIEAATAKSAPKKEDCQDFIRRALEMASGHSMKSDDLMSEAERHGYSYITFSRARSELKKKCVIDFYSTGSAKKKDRVWYTRLMPSPVDGFQEMPYDDPLPFDVPSA